MLTLAVPLGISTAGASTAVGTGLVTPVVLRGAELRAPEKPLASPGRERRAALSLDREPWSRHWWCGSPLWAGLWLMGPGTPRRLQGGQRTTALPCLTAAARYPRPTNIPRTWKSQVPSAALSHTWLRGGPARGRATTTTTTARPVRWECAWSHRLPLVRWFSDNRPGQPPGLGASSAVPLPVARTRVRTCRYRRRLRA